MPVLLGHHGREEKLPQLWQDISTSMTRSYHGRGDLTIPALNMNYERGIEEVYLLL